MSLYRVYPIMRAPHINSLKKSTIAPIIIRVYYFL